MTAAMQTTRPGQATPTATDSEEEIRLMDYPDSQEEIPTIDMSPYLKGEPGGRERVAAQLKEVTETVGFFYLKGTAYRRNSFRRSSSSPGASTRFRPT